MKILLYLKPRKDHDQTEEVTIRNLRIMIENFGYSYTFNIDDNFDIAHFVSYRDLDAINKVKEMGKPVVFSGLNNTKDLKLQIEKENNRLPYSVKSAILKADVVIAPSEEIKKILEENEISNPIIVMSPGISMSRFGTMDEIERTSFLKYAGIDEKERYCIGMLSDKNLTDLQDYSYIAGKCPRLKFFLFGDKPKRRLFNHRLNQIVDTIPKNLYIKGNVDEDLFKSALMYAQAFLMISDHYISVETILEAMVTKCQIISLNNKIYSEILIDKKTSINVNNLDEMVSKVANIVDQNIVDLSKETDDFLQTHLIDNIAPKLKNIYDKLMDISDSKE